MYSEQHFLPLITSLVRKPFKYVNLKKETLALVFSCEICEISRNTFSKRTAPLAASVNFIHTHEQLRLFNRSYAKLKNVYFLFTNLKIYFFTIAPEENWLSLGFWLDLGLEATFLEGNCPRTFFSLLFYIVVYCKMN